MFKNLKIAQRLAVLSMLFLVPVAFVLWALIAQKNVEVNFTGKEVVGTEYLNTVAPILAELEERQYDPTINIADAPSRLRDAQARFAGDLDTAQASAAAVAATEALVGNTQNIDNFQSAQNTVLALLARIGDRSNLILDNVLDSYYLSDVVLNRMPTLLDRLPDMRQFEGVAAQHDTFMLSVGAASDNRDGLDGSLASSIANNADGSVKAALAAPYQDFQTHLDEVISRFKSGQTVSSDDVAQTMNAASNFNQSALTTLHGLLQAREHHLIMDKWLTLATALLLFVGAMLLLGISILKQISGPITALTGAMGRLADSDLEVTIPSVARRDELGDMARATEVFRNNAIRNRELERSQAMEQANRARRQEAIVKLSAEFNRAVGGQLGMLSAASTELEVTANGLLDQAGTMDTHTGELLSAASHSAENAQTVAAATEELSASSREIGCQVERTTSITRLAVTDAGRARDLIAELSQAVGGVTDVVAFIDSIAAQTNLLALNATIEAARAGAAGKGFAVVAQEVKALANQTAQATGDIGKRIHAVQTTASDVTSMIAKISDIITEIDGNSDAIATAVSQQALATSEISMNAQQAASSNDAMSEDITHVREAATFTKSASSELLGAAGELAAQAAALQLEFGNFIHAMANAGDRRSDPRVDVNIKVTLRSGRNGENQASGRVVNLSEGGARVTTSQLFAEGERLQIVGLDQAVLTGLVVSSDDVGVRILFQLDAVTQKQVGALVGRLLEGQKPSTQMRMAA